MKGLLEEFQKKKNELKPTETHGGGPNLQLVENDSKLIEEDEKRREYFFEAAVDKWYENIKDCTFESAFLPISKDEAMIIINYWNNITSKSNSPIVEIPDGLLPLAEKIDQAIQNQFTKYPSVFVKLSTRSPKDSKSIFRKAEESFKLRLDSDGNVVNPSGSTSKYNERLIAFSEEMARANAVTTGKEAIILLLDSWRVAEDLMYALGLAFSSEEQRLIEEHKSSQTAPTKEFAVSLVIRGWNPRILPQTEFRGFIWNGTLNCLGQYYHSLYYPDQVVAKKDQIAADCLQFFNEKLKASLPIPNAMLDLVWLGPGEVLLIEINPLMEGLGSFKGSTGLFDYYKDHELLQGLKPFEIRVRTEEESRQEMIAHMSMEWRRVVYEF